VGLPETAPPAQRPSRDGIQIVLALAAVMWVVEIVDAIAGQRLDQYGIEPRDPDGLTGVIAAPFLHAGFGHLIANTVPFLVMGFVIALGGAARVVLVTLIVAVVSGFGTWLIGPANSIHIGASGVVFGYATYLIARGFFSRRVLEIAVGLAVGAVWGGALLAGLEPQEGISWQGHLFGAIGGLIAARALTRTRDDVSGATL
jgi:membrane associated rhomboid family serine protease